jgi:hypothetical protein
MILNLRKGTLVDFGIFVYKVINMEIVEIVSYSVNTKKNILEVSFRTMEDTEETIREDRMDYSLAEEYGYQLEEEDFDLFFDIDEDDEFDSFDDDEVFLDEDQLMSFLNEYYTVNPKQLPKPEIY